jgi:hypothetical protein
MTTAFDIERDIVILDAERIEDAQRKLKALGYMPRLGFFEAWDSFRASYFGLKATKPADILDMLDAVCQVERVGPYAPNYDGMDW